MVGSGSFQNCLSILTKLHHIGTTKFYAAFGFKEIGVPLMFGQGGNLEGVSTGHSSASDRFVED
jgi:hypothetical protein